MKDAESSSQMMMLVPGMLLLFASSFLIILSLSNGIRYDMLSFAMIILMFAFWLLYPPGIYFHRKKTNPNFSKLSDMEIDKSMTVCWGISLTCTGIGTVFALLSGNWDAVGFVPMVFPFVLLFFILQIKYRNKRRMNMKD